MSVWCDCAVRRLRRVVADPVYVRGVVEWREARRAARRYDGRDGSYCYFNRRGGGA